MTGLDSVSLYSCAPASVCTGSNFVSLGTWNALGQRLTDQKVFDAVDKLAESNINISCLIIDDNWQNIDYRGDGQFQYGWNGFEAEPKAFPQGLKATISHIREKHPNIQHIAVWHALLGTAQVHIESTELMSE
jgi:alpha-galactosidase